MFELLSLVRSSLSGLFYWWLAELRSFVPRGLTRSRRRCQRLVLTLQGAKVALSEAAGAQQQRLGEATLDAPTEIDALRATLRRAGYPRRDVTLRLGPQQGLRKMLDLPLATRDDLGQLLRFEMDRLSPFRADEVRFAYRIVASDTANRRITVELQIAPKTVVDRALAVAARLDVAPAAVELGDGGADPTAALSLLATEPGRTVRMSRLDRAPVGLALLLVATVIIMPLHHKRSVAGDLERQVAAIRAAAEESIALRERLDEIRAGVHFLVELKEKVPLMTEVLAELTRLVPDQAHLVQLKVRGTEVQLHGFARTASELIGLLDQSALFREPQFRAPVTQDPRHEAEQFHMSIGLEGEG